MDSDERSRIGSMATRELPARESFRLFLKQLGDGEQKMSMAFQRRLQRLERVIVDLDVEKSKATCTCRGRDRHEPCTLYHNSSELEKILYVPCPAHGLRNPGFIMWRPRKFPLNRSDWDYCTCPPHPLRDTAMRSHSHPGEDLPRLNSLAMARIDESNAELHKRSDEDRQREFLAESKRVDEIIASFFNGLKLERGVNV
jgi:hypothetical protein